MLEDTELISGLSLKKLLLLDPKKNPELKKLKISEFIKSLDCSSQVKAHLSKCMRTCKIKKVKGLIKKSPTDLLAAGNLGMMGYCAMRERLVDGFDSSVIKVRRVAIDKAIADVLNLKFVESDKVADVFTNKLEDQKKLEEIRRSCREQEIITIGDLIRRSLRMVARGASPFAKVMNVIVRVLAGKYEPVGKKTFYLAKIAT